MAVLRFPAGVPVVLTEHEAIRAPASQLGAARLAERPLRALRARDWRRWDGFLPAIWERFDLLQVFCEADAARGRAGWRRRWPPRVRVNPYGMILPPPCDPAREQPGHGPLHRHLRPPAQPRRRPLAGRARSCPRSGRVQPGRGCGSSAAPRRAEVLEPGRRPGVEVIADAPSMEPHLEAAAVVVAPVRSGGGMRMKVLEAIAREKAVVTTSLGAEGFAGLEPEPPLRASPTTRRAIAAAIAALLGDDGERRELGAPARASSPSATTAPPPGRRGWRASTRRPALDQRPRRRRHELDRAIELSVVIATHNRRELLRRCLDSLAHADRRPGQLRGDRRRRRLQRRHRRDGRRRCRRPSAAACCGSRRRGQPRAQNAGDRGRRGRRSASSSTTTSSPRRSWSPAHIEAHRARPDDDRDRRPDPGAGRAPTTGTRTPSPAAGASTTRSLAGRQAQLDRLLRRQRLLPARRRCSSSAASPPTCRRPIDFDLAYRALPGGLRAALLPARARRPRRPEALRARCSPTPQRQGTMHVELARRYPEAGHELLDWGRRRRPARAAPCAASRSRCASPPRPLAWLGRFLPGDGRKMIWLHFVRRFAFWRGVRSSVNRTSWAMLTHGATVVEAIAASRCCRVSVRLRPPGPAQRPHRQPQPPRAAAALPRRARRPDAGPGQLRGDRRRRRLQRRHRRMVEALRDARSRCGCLRLEKGGKSAALNAAIEAAAGSGLPLHRRRRRRLAGAGRRAPRRPPRATRGRSASAP